jgi:hypothetical protein
MFTDLPKAAGVLKLNGFQKATNSHREQISKSSSKQIKISTKTVYLIGFQTFIHVATKWLSDTLL